MTGGRPWIADPGLAWNILLVATLVEPPADRRVLAGAHELATGVGWRGDPPPVERAEALEQLLPTLAAAPEGGAPVGVGLAGRHLVLRAHHSALDGLGLLAALGVVLGAPVASSARGLPEGPARGFTGSVVQRLSEAAFSPPAVVHPTAVRPRAGDVFAARSVDAEFGTAELVVAAADAIVDHAGSGDTVVAVGVSRSGGAAPRLVDDSALVRLRRVRGRTAEEVRRLLRETPAQGSPSGSVQSGAMAAAMRQGMRVLARRLGSTVLVSHLGTVTTPAVERLAFYPVTGGGSGLSVGAVGHRHGTTVTLRARGTQHSEEGLQDILEPLCARLTMR